MICVKLDHNQMVALASQALKVATTDANAWLHIPADIEVKMVPAAVDKDGESSGEEAAEAEEKSEKEEKESAGEEASEEEAPADKKESEADEEEEEEE